MVVQSPSRPPPLGKAGLAFIAGMLVYSVFRAMVVGQTLSEYGVNPWLFLVLDAGSAMPLAWGQIRLVQGLRQRNPALVQRAIVVVTASFLAPYLYLLFGAGKPLPDVAYWIIGALVVGVGAATAWRVRMEARASPVLQMVNERKDQRP